MNIFIRQKSICFSFCLIVLLSTVSVGWCKIDLSNSFSDGYEHDYGSQKYFCPIDMSYLKLTARETSHMAIDICAPVGTPVFGMSKGNVVLVKHVSNYGNVVFINHDNGMQTRYAHLDSFKVQVGDEIKRGDCIGYVGMTGHTTGPHLHFEIILGIYGDSPWGDGNLAKLNAFEIIDMLHITNYDWFGTKKTDMLEREKKYLSDKTTIAE